jgi:hypothetical protein
LPSSEGAVQSWVQLEVPEGVAATPPMSRDSVTVPPSELVPAKWMAGFAMLAIASWGPQVAAQEAFWEGEVK